MDHLFEEQEVFQVEKLRFRVDEAPVGFKLRVSCCPSCHHLSLWLIVTQTRKVGHTQPPGLYLCTPTPATHRT